MGRGGGTAFAFFPVSQMSSRELDAELPLILAAASLIPASGGCPVCRGHSPCQSGLPVARV